MQTHWRHYSTQNHVINGNLGMMDGVSKVCVHACACMSVFAQLLRRGWLSVTPWTVARQAPVSMGFSRQECWSGVPFPSPRGLYDPGIEPGPPGPPAIHQGDCCSTSWICWQINELIHAKYFKMYLIHRKQRIDIHLDSALWTMIPA